MIHNFWIGSLLGRIKLAITHKKLFILHKKSEKLKFFLNIMIKKNIIKNFIINHNYFIIFLKFKNSNSIIKSITILSKPGKKCYVNFYKLNSLLSTKNKLYSTIYFLNTTKGILTGQESRINKIGGELLFEIRI